MADPAVAALGSGFDSDTAQVNGTTLHYVRGGAGPAIILLHGFPEDWYAYHRIMPQLAKQFTVVAVDLRGIGGSAETAGGYDAANIAEDVHQLAEHLHLEHVYVVGHDIGGMVAYAFARRYPETSRGVMMLDAPLPGLGPWDAVKANPITWHINFQQTPGLPEQLLAGREAIYLRHFLDSDIFSGLQTATVNTGASQPASLMLVTKAKTKLGNAQVPWDGNITFVISSGFEGYLTALKAPAPGIMAWIGASVEFLVGITLILGIGTRYAALLCAVFLICATALAHRYWEYPPAQMAAQQTNFLKNLAILGGTLLLFVTGPGRFSIDRILSKTR